ncbi:triadin-like isoform X2 [Scleropages formosus]|uniref:triadin-like isoform X2 n=1 Tax=Scleropages formosus TaxID=113540 RepID=UPI00087895D3|nr:triadin-like isoform X2 [Scleropages formosus]
MKTALKKEEKMKDLKVPAAEAQTKPRHAAKMTPPGRGSSTRRPAQVDTKSTKDAKEQDGKTPKPSKPAGVEEAKAKTEPAKMPYFQCVLLRSKNTKYPLYPFTPAQSPITKPQPPERRARAAGH